MAIIPQSPVSTTGKKLPQPANVERGITQVATAHSDGVSKTTDRAVRINKLHVFHYRCDDVLLRVNQINDLVIALRYIGVTRVLPLVQAFETMGSIMQEKRSLPYPQRRRHVQRRSKLLRRVPLSFAMKLRL